MTSERDLTLRPEQATIPPGHPWNRLPVVGAACALLGAVQRASRWSEAVDEYEAVVELQPAYFPALTRLAYLYFRQGLHARAVETWRRALPVCEDPALRRNIELFMRKLVADMVKSSADSA